jgi:cytochrome bd-type quinol oxidase subunit 2
MNMFEIISKVHAQGVTQIPANSISVPDLIMRIVSWALWLGGGVAVIYIIYGGFMYIAAGTDQAKAEEARQSITFAIFGVVVIALAITLITWLGRALDFGVRVDSL